MNDNLQENNETLNVSQESTVNRVDSNSFVDFFKRLILTLLLIYFVVGVILLAFLPKKSKQGFIGKCYEKYFFVFWGVVHIEDYSFDRNNLNTDSGWFVVGFDTYFDYPRNSQYNNLLK